jgi:PIN domain nuclease of toxin-antitoxin system
VILLDTHAAIWLTLERGLGRQSQRLADRALAENSLAISAFSFWEIAMLIAKQRLRQVGSAGERRAKFLAAGIRELSVTGEIAILAAQLTGLNGDPADRIIAGTAITHDATLITADRNLLRWRHPLKRQDAEA